MASDFMKEKGQRRWKGGVLSYLPKPKGKREQAWAAYPPREESGPVGICVGEVDFGLVWGDCLGN